MHAVFQVINAHLNLLFSTDILFRVVGTQLNVSTVTSRISAFNYILATQSILIAGVFQGWCCSGIISAYYKCVYMHMI